MAASDLDPALAEQYSAQIKAMLGTGLSIFAFGPDPTAGTQAHVLALPSMGLSLDLLDQINTAQLEQLAARRHRDRAGHPPGRRGASTTATRSAQEAAAGATLDQYFIIAGPNQLVVTATNASPEDAEAIANSVETLD